MSILGTIVLVIGILSLIYYGVIVSYAGMGSSFAWFWLVVAVGCLFLYLGIRFMVKYEVTVAKSLRIFIITIMILGVSTFSMIEGTLIYYANQKADPGMDYLIVLGAQVRGTRITRVLKKRLDTAVIYLMQNPTTEVIVSGGQGSGENISEAEAMKRYLLLQGINEKRIIKEERSTNTDENIRFSKGIIKDKASTVAIVTNGFHIYRAVGIAKKQGMKEVQGLSAPSDPILLINYYVREAVGVLKDKLVGNL